MLSYLTPEIISNEEGNYILGPVSAVHRNYVIVTKGILSGWVSPRFQGGDGLPGFGFSLFLSGCDC